MGGNIIAKITYEEKIESEKVWKYTFYDTQSQQENFFYHYEPIDYIPDLVGKLELVTDNDESQTKSFRSFQQNLTGTNKEYTKQENLTFLEKELDKNIEKVAQRKIKLSFDREHLHWLHNQGYTWKEIAKIYGKSESTIYRWIRPNSKPPQKRGVKLKVSNEVLDLFNSHFLQNNTATQQERVDYLYQKTGIKLHRSTISRLLKRLGITRKKLTYHYNQLDEEKAKAFNEEIKPLLNELSFIAFDECSFYPNLDPKFGYSLKGTRAISKRPSSRGEHYTLFFAISNLEKDGVVHWKLVKGKVDWKVIYDFLEEINPIGDKRNILLMDNAQIHAAPKKRKKANFPTVEEQMLKKNVEVRFITKYAPMINPAELCFNLLRQQTAKNRPRNYEEMKLAIEKVVELLNTKDLRKYFWHCVKYFDKKKKMLKM